jgi:hypothetical protein
MLAHLGKQELEFALAVNGRGHELVLPAVPEQRVTRNQGPP